MKRQKLVLEDDSGKGATLEGEDECHKVLRTVFQLPSFRAHQLEVVQHIVGNERARALVLLSTGAGKSLCYQLPAVVLGKIKERASF